MRNRKFLTTLILTLSLVCSTLLGASLIGVSASTTAPSFAITEGAYIRYDAPVGISFETKILKTEYESLQAKNAEYGTVIIPAHLLGENELTVTLDAEDNVISGVTSGLVINATSINTTVEDNEKTLEIDESSYNYYYAVVIGDKSGDTWAGLPEALYGTTLVARSYVVFDGENGREIEYAENLSTRSLAEVAKNAIASGELTADQLTACHDITEIGATKLTAVNVNTALAEINANIDLGNGDTSVIGVYVVEFGVEIDSEYYSISNGTLSFTDAYMKLLSYGKYTLKILTDKGVYLVETNIYGESTYGDERLIGFDKSSDLPIFNDTDEKVSSEWLAEFNGAKGVAKINMGNPWHGLKIKAPYTVEELQAMTWDTLEIHIYIEDIPGYTISGDIFETVWPSVAKNSWNKLQISKEDLLTTQDNGNIQFATIDDFYNALITGNKRLFAFWNEGIIYIDYINLIVKEEFNGTLDYSDPTSLFNVKAGGGQEWISSYEGANGVLKMNVGSSMWTRLAFSVNTTVDVLSSLDWDILNLKVWFEKTATNESNTLPDVYESGWFFSGGSSDAKRGIWVTLSIRKTDLATQFTTIDAFYSAITSKAGASLFCVWNTTNDNIYVDSLEFAKIDPTMNFENANTINSIVLNNASQTKTWVQEFEGATGVAQINCNGANSAIYLKTWLKLDELANVEWDALVIRMYVTKTMWTLYNGNAAIGSISTGEWTTLTIPLSIISGTNGSYADNLDGWLTAFTGSNGAPLFWSYGMSDNNPIIYIDYIDFVKLG